MSVIVVGNFDGVHIGHQKVLLAAVNKAKKLNTSSIALTFSENTKNIVSKNKKIKYLLTDKQKELKIRNIGIDNVIFQPFTKEFSEMNIEEFLLYLKSNFDCNAMVSGNNSSFGKNASWNSYDLKEVAKKFDIDVEIVPLEENKNSSSTKIRAAIEKGDIEKANSMLGYNFLIYFPVVLGKQLGRKLGFPTYNQIIPQEYVCPQNGVYLSYVTLDDKKYPSITNIGFRPTVEENASFVVAETHILNQQWKENFIGETLRVSILKKIRNEQKFKSVENLENQISKDCDIAKKYFQENLNLG